MLAEEWGCCNDCIKQLNKKLCKFFLEKLIKTRFGINARLLKRVAFLFANN